MRPKKTMNLERIDFQINQIVFAKQKGYVHWPGLIVDLHPTRNRCARVEFFGWNSQWAYISFSNLLHRHVAQEIISKNQNNAKFQKALAEMNIWLNGTLRLIQSKDASDYSKTAEDDLRLSMCSKVDTHYIENIKKDYKTKTVMNRSDPETKAMDQKEFRLRLEHADGRKTRPNVQVVNNVEHATQAKVEECSLNFRLTRSKSKANDESESSNVDTLDNKIDSKTKTVMNRLDSKTKAMDQTEIRPRSEHADGRRTRSNVQIVNIVERSTQAKIEECSLNFRLTRSKSKTNDESESSNVDTLDIKIDSKTKTVMNRLDSKTKAMDQTEIRPRSEHADGRKTRSNVQVINNDCKNSKLNSRMTRSKATPNDENDFLDTKRSSKRKRLLREQN